MSQEAKPGDMEITWRMRPGQARAFIVGMVLSVLLSAGIGFACGVFSVGAGWVK